MAEPSDLTTNQEEFMEKNVQPEVENRQEEQNEGTPAEASDGLTVPEERTKKGKEKVAEEVPLTSPLLLTGVSKGPRNQKKKGVLIKTGEEVPTAREEGVNTEAPSDVNNFPFADTAGQEDRSPVDFSSPLASSPPMQGRTFREKGESSRGTQENQAIMEMLLSMQNKMEAREKEWRLQQEFREEVYEKELKRKDQEWEEELQRREERFES